VGGLANGARFVARTAETAVTEYEDEKDNHPDDVDVDVTET
jgi:hypothetical protein